MLESLSIRNFKKHGQLDIEFSDKLTLLQGKNYQGKSSVLHAILYALGGARHVPGGSSVIRNTETGKKESVSLVFSVNGSSYKVERSGNNATLFKDGDVHATGAAPVNSEIENILGMSLKLFTLTHYSPQGESKMLVEMGAPALNRLLEEACEVSIIDEVLDKLKTRNTKLELSLEVLPEAQIDELKNKTDVLRKSLDTMSRDLMDLQTVKDDCDLYLKSSETKLTEVRKRNREIEGSINARRRLNNELESSMKVVSDCREMYDALPVLVSSSDIEIDVIATDEEICRIQVLIRDHKASERRYNEQVGELSSLQVREKDAEVTLAALPELVDTSITDSNLQNTVRSLTEAKLKVKQISTLLDGGVCPTCNRPHENFDAEQLEKDLRIAIQTEEECSQLKRELEMELSEAVASNTARTSAESLHHRLKEECEVLQVSLMNCRGEVLPASLPEDLETLEKDMESLESEYKEAVKVESQLALLRRQIDKAELDVKSAEESLKELPDVLGEVVATDVFEDTVAIARSKHQEAMAEVQQLASKVAFEKSEWSRAEADLRNAKQTEEKRKGFQKDLNTGINLTKFLRENRSKFMEGLWGSITGMASSMLDSCTGGAVSSVIRNSKGEFTYLENGREMPIAAASGCQKALIGTALKQAVCYAMPAGVPIFLSDEATADMDSEHAYAVSSYLAASGGQIVAVSHREQDGFSAGVQVCL